MSNSDGNESSNQQVDPVLSELVGEGRKFKTVADLAKGKLEADAFIENLKAENQAMREVIAAKERAAKATEFDDLIAKLKTPESSEPTVKPTQDENQVPKGLTLEEVEQYLEARQREKTVESNYAQLKGKFAEKFGEKADEAFTQALAQNKLSEDTIKNLAAANIDVALRALNFQPSKDASGQMKSTVSSEAFFSGGNPQAKNWAYFQNLRKSMRESEYYSPSIQQEIIKQRKALGEDFWR